MQEFRPASLIAADTALSERFHEGDADAVRAVVGRYGSAVAAVVTPSVGSERVDDVTCAVFVRAHAQPLAPGDDFAPWLAQIAEQFVGSVDARLWTCAMATAAIEADVRDRLRRHHLDGSEEIADDLTRHELRLRRRLAHLGDTDEIVEALGNRNAWIEADPDLAERVLDAIAPTGPTDVETDPVDEAVTAGDVDPDGRSMAARYLRPALFGLGGGLVVLFVAIIALSAASGTPQPPDFTADLIPTGAIVEVEGGEITVTARDAGLEIELEADTLPRRAASTYYEGRVLLADGNEISTGTFSEGVDVTLWAGAALDDAVRFEVAALDLAAPNDPGDVILGVDFPPE